MSLDDTNTDDVDTSTGDPASTGATGAGGGRGPRWTPARRRAARVLAVVVAVALVGWGSVAVWEATRTKTYFAEFTSVNGVYEGDPVKILGVDVGTITAITPGADSARVEMAIDHDVRLPADASAMIVAPSLVSGRFIQLTPVFTGGTELSTGATIHNTAVPVEWDALKEELTALATELSPTEEDPEGSLNRFVAGADEVLDGNGETYRKSLRELSRTMSILGDNREDIFGTVTNLQLFVSALSESHQQIMQLNTRLGSVTSLIANRNDDLARALDDLDAALGDVRRFVANNREVLVTGVDKLADVSTTLANKRPEIERLLHVAPTAMVNFYNIYKPAQGTVNGALALSQFATPVNFICGAIEGVANETSDRSAALCEQYFGTILASMAANYADVVLSPPLGVGAKPGQVVYSEPGLEGSVPGPKIEGVDPNAGAPVSAPGSLDSLLNPGGGAR